MFEAVDLGGYFNMSVVVSLSTPRTLVSGRSSRRLSFVVSDCITGLLEMISSYSQRVTSMLALDCSMLQLPHHVGLQK